MIYLVQMERIGRQHDVAPFEVEIPEGVDDERRADALAEGIFRVARTKLASREFFVDCLFSDDLKQVTVSIEADRFGKGTAVLVEPAT